MPATANGTAYTVRSATLPTHGLVYWAVADSRASSSDIPAVLYAHGSGGAANQFATLGAWAALRDWLIDNGWAWIEGTGGGATSWGNATARAAYPAYLAHVETILDVGHVVLLGRSMGGLVTAWLYAQYGGRSRFSGWINNSGVSTIFEGTVDAANAAERPTGQYFGPSMLPAWGVESYAALQSVAASYAPEGWPASAWAGKRILNLYGTSDTTVPWSPRGGGRLRELWAGQPATDLVEVRAGGDHSATNGSYLQVDAMASFLFSIGGGDTPPEPPTPTFSRVRRAYLVVGGSRFRFRPR